jgi:aspartyl-tRNA(Asn)/glutamyl-tRNA(Gln) amidotransferase subunit A
MHELPARMTQLQAHIRAGQITAQQALSAQVARGQALRQHHACVVDELSISSPAPGPLTGIALAHKDIFNLPDRQPGCGVQHGHVQVGVQAAAATQALTDAGAAQWATLVMAPHACGATAQNPHFARCVNPLDAKAAVGGSSSGSAVAVASGMTYAALGTDTAGSVRIPAATCGLIGLKTTQGAVSAQGCAPLAPALDTVGVLSRYAQDAREIWQVLRPQALRQPNTVAGPCQLWLPDEGVDSQVIQAMRDWVAQLPVHVTHIDLRDAFERLSRHAQRVLLFETAQTHRDALLTDQAEPAVRAIGLTGLGMPQAWYQESLTQRATDLAQFVDRHFQDAEFLILPALGRVLPDWQTVEVGQPTFDRTQLAAMHAFMGFVNYLGLPALNLPIARDTQDRPICVQVLARPFAEHRLLDFAEQAETIFRIF